MEWRTSREFFYWRLKRRLAENNIITTMLTLEPNMNYQSALIYIQQWFNEDHQNDVSEHFLSLPYIPSYDMFRIHNGHKTNLLLIGSSNFKRHHRRPFLTV